MIMKQQIKLSKEKLSLQRNPVQIVKQELVNVDSLTGCIEHKVDFLGGVSDCHNSWASVCSDSQRDSDDDEDDPCNEETDAYIEDEIQDVTIKSQDSRVAYNIFGQPIPFITKQ